ncbi:MAG: hypothetical protein JKY15_07210 [Deltaproteobacteria bacterium]|nr:hypothetical protein [Deltaproteobacteria bacterium]
MVLRLLVALVLLASFSINAGYVVCTGTYRALEEDNYDSFGLTLEGYLESSGIRDVKLALAYRFEGSKRTIYSKDPMVSPDANYRPWKYKGYKRFDLSDLIYSADQYYYPGDGSPYSSHVKILFPPKAESLKYFNAPSYVSADENGGSFTMNCSQGGVE